jgi:hypothetical protein
MPNKVALNAVRATLAAAMRHCGHTISEAVRWDLHRVVLIFRGIVRSFKALKVSLEHRLSDIDVNIEGPTMIALAIVIESLFICSFIRERESRHAITDTLRPVFGCCQQGLALIGENWSMFRVDGPQIGVG